MRALLDRQRAAFLRDGPPSAQVRIERLERAVGLLVDNAKAIEDALIADFGHRSREQTALSDTLPSVSALKHAKAHVRRWMRPERRSPESPFGLLGAKAAIHYQPKGVAGLIAPWNFPIYMVFGPLAGILAAGNRCLIKPSEFTPATSALIAAMIHSVFSPEEIAVVQGGADVGEAFTRLPFDHILFTGATSIGRHVMRAAADNLVPVTLELGGKSPAILGQTVKLEDAATKIMVGKLMNGGQICIAPDYALVHKNQRDAFVEAAKAAVAKTYPTLRDNPDYTSIINQRHYDRLTSYLDDAKAKGARLVEINPANEIFAQQEHRKFPPTLVLDPSDDMKVMQEEIFGPILPVKTHDGAADAVSYINAHDRPLALYYFGTDKAEQDYVLARTIAGGTTINDVIMHVAQEDLPFGGIGPSGMGHYHGHDGFKTFSHARAVYRQTGIDIGALLRPPYNERMRKLVGGRIKR
ncbi:MAG: coniferyl aldehyde dehydrogenase [Alphaproteobacteria bacterium]